MIFIFYAQTIVPIFQRWIEKWYIRLLSFLLSTQNVKYSRCFKAVPRFKYLLQRNRYLSTFILFKVKSRTISAALFYLKKKKKIHIIFQIDRVRLSRGKVRKKNRDHVPGHTRIIWNGRRSGQGATISQLYDQPFYLLVDNTTPTPVCADCSSLDLSLSSLFSFFFKFHFTSFFSIEGEGGYKYLSSRSRRTPFSHSHARNGRFLFGHGSIVRRNRSR